MVFLMVLLPEQVFFMFHGTVTEIHLDFQSVVPSTIRLWQGEMDFRMILGVTL